jgi:hypothetical protein
MNTQTLNSVTLQTLGNYRTAATRAMVAYRLGGHRLVGAINKVLADSVYPRTAQIAPRTTLRMDEMRDSISNVLAKGIDEVVDRAVNAIESSSNTAAAQLTRASEFAGRVDNPIVASGLQSAARLVMPGAEVARVVSSKVAQAAHAIADAAGARPVRKTVRKAAAGAKRKAAPIVRKAKTAARKAARRA